MPGAFNTGGGQRVASSLIREVNAKLGLQPEDYKLAQFPELRPAYDAWIKRVAALPWLPAWWLSELEKYRREFPDALFTPRDAARPPDFTQKIGDSPTFIDTPEKARAWNELLEAWRAAFMPVIEGYVQRGRAEMERLNADAVFWDRLYRIAKPIAALPESIAGAAGGIVTGVAGKLLIPAALVAAGVLAFVYLRREVVKK